MRRFFVDSSVLFPAIYSERGKARDMLNIAANDEITLVISDYVIDEVRLSLEDKAPEITDHFTALLEAVPFELAKRPSAAMVEQAAEHVADPEDAPIIAAAKSAQVDALVTFDRKHLLGKAKVAEYLGIPVITPARALDETIS